MPLKPPIALTIAGFDPSSGAGITADLQVFAALGLYGTSAISVMTVQSTLGVAATEPISPTLLAQTLDHLQADLPPAGVKIGALGSKKNAAIIAAWLPKAFQTGKIISQLPVVFDPVLASSSGHALFPAADLQALRTTLFPHVGWITPNWRELALLTSLPVSDIKQAETAAEALAAHHPHLNIVVTAGDQAAPTDLLRIATGEWHNYPGTHVASNSTHGTGCAFSAALLAYLILGESPIHAVAAAKAYVAETIRTASGIGHGKGPLNLLWPLKREGAKP